MFGKKDKFRSERKIFASGYTPETEQEKLLSFSIKEAYKAVRTNIVLSLIKDGCKIITFTSPIPSEGKSTTVSNIAVSLSKAFYKVLLIDCDLLKPRLHRTFKLKNVSGISNVLSRMSTFEQSVQILEKYSGLHILTAGIAVPNPSEMLGSTKMKELLTRLSEKYDYILLDSPPINIISDGLSLATVSDGVVLVVRQDYSTHDEIKQALSSLQFVSAKVLGIVYNGASNEKMGSSYEKKSKKYTKYGRYARYGRYASYGYAAMYGDTDRNTVKTEGDKFIQVENKPDSEESDEHQ